MYNENMNCRKKLYEDFVKKTVLQI